MSEWCRGVSGVDAKRSKKSSATFRPCTEWRNVGERAAMKNAATVFLCRGGGVVMGEVGEKIYDIVGVEIRNTIKKYYRGTENWEGAWGARRYSVPGRG